MPKGRTPNGTTHLIALADNVACWHTPDGDPYVTLRIGDHQETYALRSRFFRTWLEHRYYRVTHNAASSEALTAALGVLEGRARFDGPEHAVAVRLAEHEGNIYLDLADPTWRVVEVSPTGWRLIDSAACPVYFRRPRGLRPLPRPERGGTIDELRPWLNVRNTTDWRLCVAWLLAALRPRGPYPLLALHGEHGAAKSTTARILRSFVDPNKADLRAQPRSAHDLVIAATNGWVIALDNLSRVPLWLSDALCRLSTGGGYGTRELYTDQDEILLDVQRPVALTGIEPLATRDDLADRAIPTRLPAIDDDRRYTEVALWAAIEEMRPRVLGALLDAVAMGLGRVGSVQLSQKPRMADFAVWVTACAPALGWRPQAFLDAYTARRREAVEVVLEASTVATALRAFLPWYRTQKSRSVWIGTADRLRTRLASYVPDDAKQDTQRWPRTPRGLSSALRRLAPDLRRVGIPLTFLPREAGARKIRIAIPTA